MKQGVFALAVVFALFTVFGVFADVVVLFDEDEKTEAGNGDFAALFTSHDAGSTVEVTDEDAISGQVSAYCTVSQSYNNAMAGWDYRISSNDYRFITFAWKKVGGTGMMIQLAHDTAWAYRYVDVKDIPGWGSIVLSNELPEDWVVYTRNLVDDFVDGWTLTGLALTPYDGEGGYYDYIVLHTEEAEGQIEPEAVGPQGKLATAWAALK